MDSSNKARTFDWNPIWEFNNCFTVWGARIRGYRRGRRYFRILPDACGLRSCVWTYFKKTPCAVLVRWWDGEQIKFTNCFTNYLLFYFLAPEAPLFYRNADEAKGIFRMTGVSGIRLCTRTHLRKGHVPHSPVCLIYFMLFPKTSSSSSSLCHAISTDTATVVQGDSKAPFPIATTPMCKGGWYSFPWIALPYPWSVPYIAEF